MADPATDLLRFIDAAPHPAHAAAALANELRAAGFSELAADQPWALAPGRFLVRRHASLIAFVLRGRALRRFHLVAAHTDSPNLRLKPRAPFAAEGCLQLAVEVYGGALRNSWLDRDLGLAGVVQRRDGSAVLIDLRRPLARVPQLAIHLDRTINDDGLKLNPQTHLAPIWGLSEGRDAGHEFAVMIAQAAGCAGEDILAHDLALYDLCPATVGGVRGELIFAGRLDNLMSCHAGAGALIAAADGEPGTVPVLACFDHEEVGSDSEAGAGGAFLGQVLERIGLAAGFGREDHFAALARSLLLSADMAHAVHPNYADRHEPRHRPLLGQGPVLKSNVNQRYATSAATAAAVRALAASAGIAVQDFVARSDLGCGSTVGPITAARLGIAVADVGAPLLSMHSARECAATADVAPYAALLTAHLRG